MFRKDPSYTRGPRCPHDSTCGTRPTATESEQRDPPGGFHLSHPATASGNYLVTLWSRKQRFLHTQTSETVRSHEAPRAMGRIHVSQCKKLRASGVGNKYSCHLYQQSKWTSPGILHRIWYRNPCHSRCIIQLQSPSFESILAIDSYS